MDFEIDDEQRLLVDSVSRWLDTDYCFEDFRRFAADPAAAKDNWARFAELGLLGVNIAEADGGLGAGAVETLLIMRLFGRALVVDPYISNAVIAVALVSQEPAGERRRQLLEQIADGSCRVALAALEPKGRFELHHIDTTATAHGAGFTLNGKKAVVIHGDSAQQLIVSARTSSEGSGTSLFLVAADAPGVRISGFPTIDGQRAAEIEFHEVQLGAGALLGGLHLGAGALEWAVDRGIAALCAEAVGVMERLLEMTAEHLRTRKQFGQAIGTFQALQHRLADMAIAVEQSRSVAVLAAAKIDSADRVERRRAVSAAKAMVGWCGRTVAEAAVQLHGGMGMTDDMPVGYYFKRLIAIDMSWGNSDHHVALYGELM